MPLCLVVSLKRNWQPYAFYAGRDNPCCNQSRSVMCLNVGHSTKDGWSGISGTFTGALMVTAKNSCRSVAQADATLHVPYCCYDVVCAGHQGGFFPLYW